MDSRIIGTNLLHFRNAHKLTQEEVASIAGVKRETYAKIEKSLQNVSVGPLVNLCNHYGISMATLLSPLEIPQVACLTRKHANRFSSAQHKEDIRQAYEWAKGFRFLRKCLGISLEQDMALVEDLRNLVDSIQARPEQVALAIRRKLLESGGFTVEVLPALFDNHGILFCLRSLECEDTRGFTFEEPSVGVCIVVNDNDRFSQEQKIFTAVHEFAHVLFGTCGMDYGSIGSHAPEEVEADCFARELLAPRQAVVGFWKKLSHLSFYDSIVKTKHAFKVPASLIIHQLEGELSNRYGNNQNWYSRFNAMAKQRGLSCYSEISPIKIDFEQIGFLAYAYEAYHKGCITLSRLAELTGCSIHYVTEALKKARCHV